MCRGLAGHASAVTLHLEDGTEVRRSRGLKPGVMTPQRWSLQDLQGRRVFVRLVDRSTNQHSYVALDDWVLNGRLDETATAHRRQRLERERRTSLKPLEAAIDRASDVVFAVRQPGQNGHYYVNFGRWCNGVDRWEYGSGGRLCRWRPRTGQVTVLLDDSQGGVRDPQVSYDGSKILFSYRPGGTHRYHLYEMAADGSHVRQLTDGDYDDIEPTYLPDGRIVFCSTRARRIVNCNLVEVALLFVCDADGSNMRQLSSNNETENTPWPLPDGRVLFTRWEYVDRSIGPFKALWSMEPDGAGVMTYFGNMHPGNYIDAKPIPGSREVVLIRTTHMGREHIGTLAVLNPDRGPDHLPSLKTISWEGDLRDPTALGQTGFLAAREHQLVAVTRDGVTQVLYALPSEDHARGRWIHEPRLLRARPHEPVIPSRVDLTQETGQLLLRDVHIGRNMDGIAPGDIKKLLVLEVLPKPVNFSGKADPVGFDHTFTLFRILGTVPVEPDGSAWLEVPALHSLLFVALDEADRSLKRMQSFVTVQPGEVTGCVGCHEPRHQTPVMDRPGMLALKRGPHTVAPLAGVPDVIDYPRDIQPLEE